MQITTAHKTIRTFLIAALSLAAVAPVATGCAVMDTQQPEEEAGQGTIVMPLVHTGPDGSMYQLLNATFEVDGPGGIQLFSGDVDSTLNLSLSPGYTSIRLLEGWELWRTPDAGTTAEPVPAVLGTANPLTLRVLANHTETLFFSFIVRDPKGDIEIDFGVSTEPSLLAGELTVSEATGAFEPYLEYFRLDFAFYFKLYASFTRTLEDGTKERIFYAGNFQDNPTPVAGEFFNDDIGLLSDVVGPALAGNYIEYRIAARPDGSIEFSGRLSGGSTPYPVIEFGPAQTWVPLDEEGFPVDAAFYEAFTPFTMSAYILDSGEATMSGYLDLSYVP